MLDPVKVLGDSMEDRMLTSTRAGKQSGGPRSSSPAAFVFLFPVGMGSHMGPEIPMIVASGGTRAGGPLSPFQAMCWMLCHDFHSFPESDCGPDLQRLCKILRRSWVFTCLTARFCDCPSLTWTMPFPSLLNQTSKFCARVEFADSPECAGADRSGQ